MQLWNTTAHKDGYQDNYQSQSEEFHIVKYSIYSNLLNPEWIDNDFKMVLGEFNGF